MNTSLLSPASSVIGDDLAEIVLHSEPDLIRITDSHTLITGATGFVGSWLTLSWLYSRQLLGTTGQLTVIARNFSKELISLYESFGKIVKINESDIRNLRQNTLSDAQNIVHAANPVSQYTNYESFKETVSIIVDGQKTLLAALGEASDRNIVFTSSGAVYGKQPFELARIDESYIGAPDPLDPHNGYHEAKRLAEQIGVVWASENNACFKIARLFAFLAPALPMERHFAAGNFLHDALKGKAIRINSRGDSIRSYQYGSDMASWIWAILLRGEASTAYNVGSDQAITILDLATKISDIAGLEHLPIIDRSSRHAPSRYVPSVEKARNKLGLKNYIELDDAILRSLRWHRGD